MNIRRVCLASLMTMSLLGSILGSAHAAPRSVRFKNTCNAPVSLTYKLPNQTLQNYSIGLGQSKSILIGSLGTGKANAFFAVLAPKPLPKKGSFCATYDCGTWGDYINKQPNGHDWLGKWEVYATACQVSLARAGACSGNAQAGCCGPNVYNNGTFGSLFEITPSGYAGLDYIDISTNFDLNNGSNVFFSIPYQVVVSAPNACIRNGASVPKNTLTCLTADCADGYQTPTDPKQVACSGLSNYLVQFCPPSGKHPYR